MKRHAIPQDIMSVEFKLFGEFTIKQFLYVGGGAALAYLVFASEMSILFKIPLGLLFGAGGAALALIPINNRPLEVWLANYLTAMFSPTKRVWKKNTRNPMKPALPQTQKAATSTGAVYNMAPTAAPPKSLPSNNSTGGPQPTQQPMNTGNTTSSSVSQQNAAQPQVSQPQPSMSQAQTPQQPASTPQQSQQGPAKTLAEIQEEAPKKENRQTLILDVTKLHDHAINIPGYKPLPNILKGVVKDKNGNLITGAVVIIKRKVDNEPARAVVTNPLGEFHVSTPLDNGIYLIDISHNNTELPLYEINLTGNAVPPMQFQFTA